MDQNACSCLRLNSTVYVSRKLAAEIPKCDNLPQKILVHAQPARALPYRTDLYPHLSIPVSYFPPDVGRKRSRDSQAVSTLNASELFQACDSYE